MQTLGDTSLFFLYDANGLIGFDHIVSGTTQDTYYYQVDGKGEIVGITDKAGNILVKYTYDAWGNPTSITDGNGTAITNNSNIGIINPFRYKSYYYDTDTGLYYLNSRYYDPQVCRFISVDSFKVLTATPTGTTDKNLFTYCDNNPVMRADNNGQFWGTLFDIISLGASVVEVCVNPTSWWSWAGLVGDIIDVAIPFVSGVGEAVRAIKTVDKATDVIQIAKAVDFTEDAADIVKSLDRSSGFTKSTTSAGIKIHEGYKATHNFSPKGKEFRQIKGIRPDYIDFDNNVIYELKPMNPRGVISGIRQLQRYNKALGGGFTLRLELY